MADRKTIATLAGQVRVEVFAGRVVLSFPAPHGVAADAVEWRMSRDDAAAVRAALDAALLTLATPPASS